MPGTKWVLTNLAIISLRRSPKSVYNYRLREIETGSIFDGTFGSVIATELWAQFKLLGRIVSLKEKKRIQYW